MEVQSVNAYIYRRELAAQSGKETLIESEFPAVQGRTAKINDANH